jgi:tripartite-type tricarboxylate transporter receptor subunit TctC
LEHREAPLNVEHLNKEVGAGLADPKLKARLAEFGALPLVGSPTEFSGLVAEETEKWGKVVKFAGFKPE